MRAPALALACLLTATACGTPQPAASSPSAVAPAPSSTVAPTIAPTPTTPARPPSALQWTRSSGFPVGGVVWSLQADPVDPKKLYAGIENLGFMISTDGGSTWERHDTGHHFPRRIVLDALDERIGYYTYGGGVSVMDRTGAFVRQFGLGRKANYEPENQVQDLAVAPSGSLFLTSLAGVFKTSDQGVTVEQVGAGLPSGTIFGPLAIDPADPNVMYLGTRGPWYYNSTFTYYVPKEYRAKGMYRSTDAGRTWSVVGGGAFGGVESINSIVIDARRVVAGTSRGVFVSDDAGSTWRASSSGLADTRVWVMLADPRDGGRLYAGTWGGGLFVSRDGAATWEPAGHNKVGFHEDRVFSLAPDRGTTGGLYIGTGDGLFRYDPISRRSVRVDGLLPTSAAAYLALGPQDASRLFVLDGGSGGGRDLHRSSDGGKTWKFVGPFRPLEAVNCPELLFSLECPTYPMDHRYGMQVQVDPHDPRKVLFSSAYGLFVSKDGGDTWALVPTGVIKEQFSHIHGIAIHPERPEIIYAVTGGQVASTGLFTHALKSTDGGASWSFIDNGLPKQNYHMDVVVHPKDPNIAYVFGTTTGFGCQPSHNPMPKCVPVGIYKTVDGGRSWNEAMSGLTDLDVLAVRFDPSDPKILYAAAGLSLYRSGDAGATWSKLYTPGGQTRVSTVAIDPRDPKSVVVGTWGAGVVLSRDGGRTWASGSDGLTGSQIDPRARGRGDSPSRLADVLDLQIDPRTNTIYAAAGGVYTARFGR